MQHLSMMSVALLWFRRPQAESWVGRIQPLPAQVVGVEAAAAVVVVDILVFVWLFSYWWFCSRGGDAYESKGFRFEDRIG